MASWLMRMVSSSGKSSRRRRAICSGLHAVAHRRSCRRPRRRPFHGTTGPRTAAPFGAMMTPASRSCTYRRSGSLIASLAAFGRRADRSACHCAVVARYARPPRRVAALRRSSREIVDGARFSRRAISRTPCRCARQIAISSRSANDRERPDSGFADGARWDGGMPPALRNQRAPTAGDTPAPTAASSLEHPAAMAAQNRWRSSRRATEGRPGEGKAPRPDRSERRFRTVIATSSPKVLRRPLEPKLYVIVLTDYVTKDLHKQARQGGTRMAVQDSQGVNTFYPDDLLPKIQQILAIMADLELRYETDRYHLENWSGPRAIKAHVLANLEQSYKANRERYEVCLEELRSRTRAHIEGSHRIHQKLAPAASMQTKH